jgi:hypothetical protein
MGCHCQGLPSQSPYLIGYFFQVGKFAASHRNICASLSKAQSNSPSNATAAAGYQSHFTIERKLGKGHLHYLLSSFS